MKRNAIIITLFLVAITTLPLSASLLDFKAPTSRLGRTAYKIAAGIAGIFCANKSLKKAFNSLDLQMTQYDCCQTQPPLQQPTITTTSYYPSSKFQITAGETNYFETFFALAFGYVSYRCLKIALTS